MSSKGASNSTVKTVRTKFLAVLMSALLALSLFNVAAFATGDGESLLFSPAEETAATVQFNLENAFVAVNNQPIEASMAVAGIPTGQDLVFVAAPITNAKLTVVEATNSSGAAVTITQVNNEGTYSIPAGFVDSSLVVTVKATVTNDAERYEATGIDGFDADAYDITANDFVTRGLPDASQSDRLTFGIDLLGAPTMDGLTALVPSGRSQVATFTLFAASMDGVIVLVPKTSASYASLGNFQAVNADVTHGLITASQMAALGITYNGVALEGDHFAVVIPRDAAWTGGFSSNFSLTYGFNNGTTPTGATQPITGYAFEGTAAAAGSGILGSAITIANGGAAILPVKSYTLKATTNENISVSKTYYSVNEEGTGANGSFSTLKERLYGDITSGNDSFSITYKLGVATTGNGAEGRIFQQSVQVTDVISGFRADAPPTKVTVDGTEVALSGSGSERSFTIDVPLADGLVIHKEYTVVVTYSKNAYTNMYGKEPVLAGLQQVANQAKVTNTPVVGEAVTSELTAPIVTSFGYYQGNPSTVSLVIQKKWKVGSESDLYTEKWQQIFGDANNPVTFKLVPQPGSPSEAVELTSEVDAFGNVSFIGLVPGITYQLRETLNIGPRFDAMSPVNVVVSALDNSGRATVTIGGADYTNKPYQVTNTGTGVGNIEVRVKQQKQFESPAQYNTQPDGITVYLKNGNAVVAEGKTSQGVVMFYNIDVSGSYTLEGEGIENYVISAPSTGSVTASSSTTKAYDITYNSDKGSFKLGKVFKGPDGAEISVGNFEAVFQMYDSSGSEVGNPITITSRYGSGSAATGAGVIQQIYPEGTYTLKETSLKIGGVDATNEYSPYEGTVSISAGEFGSLPSGSNEGLVTNASRYGQLTVKNFNFAGSALGGFSYSIKNNATGVTTSLTMAASSGTSTLLLPAGAYTITQTLKTGYVLLTENSVVVEVEAGTASVDKLTVNGTGAGETRTLNYAAGNVQTVGFINAYAPNYSIKKVAADDSSKAVYGAVFMLYKKTDAGYQLVKSGSSALTATSNSSGYITFNYLEAGDYLLVERTPATGYASPAYVENFKDGSGWKETVAGDNGAPSFTIGYADYGTSSRTITATGTIANVRYAAARIMTLATDTGNAISGATYQLYSGNTLIGTASPTSSNYLYFTHNGSTVYLGPGTYTIKQASLSNNAYVLRNIEDLTFVVSENGAVKVPDSQSTFYQYNKAAASVDGSNVLSIAFANMPKPNTTVVKMGETDVFDKEGERILAPLAGVEFKVYYETGEDDEKVKHYITFNANNEMIGVASSKEEATTLKSQANGTFLVNYLDPSVSPKYFVEEITLPTVPGSDQPYSTLETGSISIDTERVDGKLSHYKTEDLTIKNLIDPYWIKITKYGLFEKDNQLYTNEQWTTLKDEADERNVNGEFEIYRLNEATQTWELIDTITTGGEGDVGVGGGSAVTKQLTLGKYRIVEIQPPIETIGSKGYVRDKDGPIEDKNGNWREDTRKDENNHLYWEYEITEESKRWTEIDLGNDAFTPNYTPVWIRLYLEKTGYTLDAEGNAAYQGKLNGVQFEVYYAYIPKGSDNYVISSDLLQTVTSGSLLLSSSMLDPGRFLTFYGTLEEMQRAAKGNGGTPNEYDAIGYVVKEVGNLPEQYQNNGAAGTEYFIPIDEDYYEGKKGLHTVGERDENDKLIPIELKNYAGSGELSLFKYGATTSTVISDAEFKLYRGASEDAEPSTWQEVMTIKPGSSAAQGIKLPAGFYFLQEVKPGAGYNDAGTYQVKTTDAKGKVTTSPNKSFGPNDAISLAIGGDAKVSVSAFDQRQTTLYLKNYWNGSTNSSVNSTYKISGPGFNEGNNQITVSGTGSASFYYNLANGTYTIVEQSVSGASANEFSMNGEASSKGITVTVENGMVTVLKVDGISVPYNTPNSANGIWYTGTLNSTSSFATINVNHVAKGSLVVKMGSIDAVGSASTSMLNATATFLVEKKSGDDWVLATAGNLVNGIATWNQSDLKILLDQGDYRITQQTVSNPSYLIDSTPVYFKVGQDGIVYLENNKLVDGNSNTWGKESTEASPLMSSNTTTSSRFYNKQNFGRLAIYKGGEGTALLSGAVFAVYRDAATTDLATTLTTTTAGATADLAPGTYWVKETKAPSGYAARSELFQVTITGNKTTTASGSVNYADQTKNSNALGIKNAKLASFTVVKSTTYPEIEGVVEASESKVARLPVTLYKLSDQGVYEPIRIPNSATFENYTRISDNASEYGTLVFSGLEEGTYRVVESLPADGSLDYLTLNEHYASVESTFDIEVKYNLSANRLDVSATGAPAGDMVVDAQGNATLTIHNDFIGVRIGVKKVDKDNEAKAVKGARFELYDVDPRTDPEAKPISSSEKNYETDVNGFAYFDPRYIGLSSGETKTYYVKETYVPSPYIIDEFYEDTVKEVVVSGEGSQAITVFKNKAVNTYSSLSITKSADPTAAASPLRSSALDAEFIIQPKASQGNTLQLKNYTVSDADFTFYGLSATNTEVQLTGANMPTYQINSVDVYGATSKKTATGTDTPVYASVDNGATWQLLSADPAIATTFALGQNATSLKVIYSDANPNGGIPTLGADFKVGKIVLNVTFNKFEPANASVPEVTKIKNVATVKATEGAIALTQATAQATITVPVVDRPRMSISKTINTTTTQKPGGTLEYSLTVKNESSLASIFNPVIIDTLQADSLYIKRDSNGDPIYRILDGDGAEVAGETFTVNATGDTVMWALYGYELEPGATLKVTFEASLAGVIEGDVVTNTAYATSATPLSYSTKYPTGASFVGYPTTSEVTATNAHAATYAELAKMHAGFEAGIYVKSNTTSTGIARSGGTGVQRAIKVNDGGWNASSTPSAVQPGDTISYQFSLKNDNSSDGPTAKQIRLAEILPNPNDMSFTGGSRGTEWTQELFELIRFNADIQASSSKGDATIADIKYSNEASGNVDALIGSPGITIPANATLADFKSFIVSLDPSFALYPGDILTITYSITLPELDQFTETMLHENVLKMANATFIPVFEYGSLVSKVQESNVVKAKLVLDPISIEGSAFDDNDADGYFTEGVDAYKSGVTVTLERITGEGTTWNQHGSATVTDAEGKYKFTGLESTYGYEGYEYRVVFTNDDPISNVFSFDPGTAKPDTINTHVATASDDLVYGYTPGAALVADQQWNVGLQKRDYKVVYRSGVDAGATNQAQGIPSEEDVAFSSTYTVKGDAPVPTRLGYTFAGWAVTEGGSSLDSSYDAGETFAMPANNVTLTAQWEIDNRIEVAGYTGVYDGQSHGITIVGAVETDVVEYIIDGTTYSAAEFDNEFKDVDDSATVDIIVKRDGAVIYDSTDDVAPHAPAVVSITPATLHVKTDSNVNCIYNGGWHYVNGTAYAEYGDGTPTGTIATSETTLVSQAATSVGLAPGETVTITVTGKEKDVNYDQGVTENNTYAIDWGSAKESNYTLLEEIGTIIVKEYPEQISVQVTGGTWYYDGVAHGATVNPIVLPDGYSIKGTPTSSATIKDVQFDGSDNVTAIEATCDNLTIVNASDEVVYKIENGVTSVEILDVEIVPGSLKVLPATVYITTENASKEYDGAALTTLGDGYTQYGNGTGGLTNSIPFSLDGANRWVSLIPGENVKIKLTGSQTEVGSSLDDYDVTWGDIKKSNYVFSENLGTLTVTGITDKVIVTVAEAEKTYDGTPLVPGVSVTNLPAALYTVETATSNVSLTDVSGAGDGKVAATVETLVIKNKTGQVVAKIENGQIVEAETILDLQIVDGWAKVNPVLVQVVTGQELNYVYDGTTLTRGGTITVGSAAAQEFAYDPGTEITLVNGETATIKTTGSITEPGGPIENGYSLTWNMASGAKSANYVVSSTVGKLSIIDNQTPLVFTVTGGEWVYDGQTHEASVNKPELPQGYYYDVEPATNASIKNAFDGAGGNGLVTASLDELVIKNSKGDIVAQIVGGGLETTLNITIVEATLKVTKATIDLVTESGSFIYDGTTAWTAGGSASITYGNGSTMVGPTEFAYDPGTELDLVPGEKAQFKTTGSQLEVNFGQGVEKNNTYDIDFTQADSRNYEVVENLGTLIVSESDEDIVVTLTGGTWVYDSAFHMATIDSITLPAGYELVGAPSTLAAVKNVSDGEVTATCDNLAIKNSATGQVVYALENGVVSQGSTLNVEIIPTTIKVIPASIDIVTFGGEKDYDNIPLMADGSISVTIGDGTASAGTKAAVDTDLTTQVKTSITLIEAPLGGPQVDDEQIYITVTGTQTVPGSSENSYDIEWNGVQQSNYTVNEVKANLVVNEYLGKVTVVIGTVEKEYDGTPLAAPIEVQGLPAGGLYTVDSLVTSATATHVSQGAVSAVCDDLVIKNASGQVVARAQNGSIVAAETTLDVALTTGTIKINPVPLSIETGSALDQVYTGSPLTKGGTATLTVNGVPGAAQAFGYLPGNTIGLVNGETATLATTGTITEPGSVTNGHSISFNGDAQATDYSVTVAEGTLSVVNIQQEIVFTITGGTWVYDGKAHKGSIDKPELPEGYYYSVDPATTVSVTNVAEGSVQAYLTDVEIKNAQGTIVFQVQNGLVKIQSINTRVVQDYIKITPAKVFVSTGSKDFLYDGATYWTENGRVYTEYGQKESGEPYRTLERPITTEGSIVSLVPGEEVRLTVTGKQRDVNFGDASAAGNNLYGIEWGTTEESNYELVDTLGTLIVKDSEEQIVVFVQGGTWEYDGQAHGANISPITLPVGYSLDGTPESAARALDVEDGEVPATVDTLKIDRTSDNTTAYQIEDGSVVDTEDHDLRVMVVDGTLKITPVPVHVTTFSNTFVYDGDAKTMGGEVVVTAQGVAGAAQAIAYTPGTPVTLVNGETATFSTTGTVTEPGEGTVQNTSTVSFPSNVKETNYLITKQEGTLNVVDNPEAVIIEAIGDTWVYDAQDHSATLSYPALPTGYSYDVIKTNSSVKNVADGTVWATADELVIVNKQGTVVAEVDSVDSNGAITWKTKSINVSVTPGAISIAPAVIHVGTDNGVFTYDGATEWTADGSAYTVYGGTAGGIGSTTTAVASFTPSGNDIGLVPGEVVTFVITGKQRDVNFGMGVLDNNTYEIAWGAVDPGNYVTDESLGELIVKDSDEQIVIELAGGTWEYDGQAHGATVKPIALPNGYSISVQPETLATVTDVDEGTKTATIDNLTISDASNRVVYAIVDGAVVVELLEVEVLTDTIQVTPVPIEVTTFGDVFVYDGTAKTMGGEVVVSAQGVAGTAQAFAYQPGSPIALVNGETAVFSTISSLVQPAGLINNEYAIEWNGNKASNYSITDVLGELQVIDYQDELVIEVMGGTWVYDANQHGGTLNLPVLPQGYFWKAVDSTARVTNVSEGIVPATVDVLEIVDAQGRTVAKIETGILTSELDITIVPSVLEVTPQTLTVTMDSGYKVYDGTPLTAGGSYTGIQGNEQISFNITGSQTAVGSSDNSYFIDWSKSTAFESNYTVNTIPGTLTVTESTDQIVVTTVGGTFTYDGTVRGGLVSVANLPAGYKVETASSDTQQADVVDGAVVKCDNLVIRNAQDEDVTSRLNIRYVDGTLTIKPAMLLVTTDSASRAYDGTALTASGRVSGLMNGETVDFYTTGSQTGVGSSQNTYALNWIGSAKQSNYTVVDRLGVLTVAAAPSTGGGTIIVNPGGGGGTTVVYNPSASTDADDPIDAIITPIASALESGVGGMNPRNNATIDDEGTPLYSGDDVAWCWVHWYILLGIVITALYGAIVIFRRRRFTKDLRNFEDEAMGHAEDSQAQYGRRGYGSPAAQGIGA